MLSLLLAYKKYKIKKGDSVLKGKAAIIYNQRAICQINN